MINQPKKVFVGLSGGVDSAVTCYLLKKQGYDVQAVFMQNWDPISNHEIYHENQHCQANEDFQMAKKVASFLEIPIIKVNFVAEYWEKVFQPFLNRIKSGQIPNPDVDCNSRIKFNVLLQYLIKRYQFDYFATGHYAKIKKQGNNYFLVRALDPIKDQTYFLAGIDQRYLPKLLFPLGTMLKTEVRKIAQQIQLPNFQRKESMGICFIGKRRFEQFLQQYLPKNPGMLVDFLTKKLVGKHDGAIFYTPGQRKRLYMQTTQKHFVIGKDVTKNVVYVVNQVHRNLLLNNTCQLNNINWFLTTKETSWTECFVKLRHCQLPLAARYQFVQNKIILKLNKLVLAITPGQLAVIYDLEFKVLGSGVIQFVLKNNQPVWYL